VAWLALFVALGGTGAYAANTIGSDDIIDGQVKSVDVANQDLTSSDIKDGSINTFDLTDGAGVAGTDIIDNDITTADIKNFTLGNGDFLIGSVDSRVATDNSLTGADINESTLNMPPTTTATFAGSGFVDLNDDSSFTKVVGKTLPAGSYAITATANIGGVMISGADADRSTSCELRNGTGFIGGGGPDRRRTHSGEQTRISLSMNGGAQVPAGGGEVSLWCMYQGAGGTITNSQMMIIRLDGFF
jgi:hypothetical protein